MLQKQNDPLTSKDVFWIAGFVVYGIVENADVHGVAADAAVVTAVALVLFSKSQVFILLCTQTALSFNLLVHYYFGCTVSLLLRSLYAYLPEFSNEKPFATFL